MGISLNSKHHGSNTSIRAYCMQQRLQFALEQFVLPPEVPLSWSTPAARPQRAAPCAERGAGAWMNLQRENLQQETHHKQSCCGDLAKGKQWAEQSEHHFFKEKQNQIGTYSRSVFWVQPLPGSRLISLSKEARLSSLNPHADEGPVTRDLDLL